MSAQHRVLRRFLSPRLEKAQRGDHQRAAERLERRPHPNIGEAA